MKKQISFLVTLLIMLYCSSLFAQTTFTGTLNQEVRDGHSIVTWTVPDGSFDSTDVIYSPPFMLEGTASTFDANGIIDLGTVATADLTYDSEFLLLASSKSGNTTVQADTLSASVTATTPTTFSIDLDDFDQFTNYQIKATNSGGDNTIWIEIFTE